MFTLKSIYAEQMCELFAVMKKSKKMFFFYLTIKKKALLWKNVIFITENT
jgi:hypothetical protein